jgi:hypothetical protein
MGKPVQSATFSTWFSKHLIKKQCEQHLFLIQDFFEKHGQVWPCVMQWFDDHPGMSQRLQRKVATLNQMAHVFETYNSRTDHWEVLDKSTTFWEALTTWDKPPRECAMCCGALTSRNVFVMQCGHSSVCKACMLAMPLLRGDQMTCCPMCRKEVGAPHETLVPHLCSLESAQECDAREGVLDSLHNSIVWTCQQALAHMGAKT